MKPVCEIENCNRLSIGRQTVCKLHYERIRKTGHAWSQKNENQKPRYNLPYDIPREHLIIWAAGFFDGEGHIRMVHRKSWSMALTIPQCETSSLERLQGLFGGNVYKDTYVDKFPNRRPIWKWYIGGERAKIALKEMLPYLTVKHARANEVFELLQLK